MAVNGIDLAFGQVWKTRDGRYATIVSDSGGHADYPIIAELSPGDQKSYGLDGRFSAVAETSNDLIRYVCNGAVNAGGPVGDIDVTLQSPGATEDGASMFVPGYEKLAAVMAKAYDQAARGKGKERHANSKPFHEQPMLTICRNLGSIDGMLYQATKKAMEARGLPTKDRALAEIYGAINYLAGAAILIEEGIIKGQE